MRPYGQIILFNATKGGIFSSGQRFFTRLPYTHTALITPSILGDDYYYGADLTVDIKPMSDFLTNTDMYYQIVQPQGWTQKQIDNALRRILIREAGKTYGILQIAYFIYRGIAEVWPFYADVRKKHNPFPNGVICSELVWWYLWFLYEERPELTQLRDKLNEWRPDTFHAGDTSRVLEFFPDLFKWTEERWSGPR